MFGGFCWGLRVSIVGASDDFACFALELSVSLECLLYIAICRYVPVCQAPATRNPFLACGRITVGYYISVNQCHYQHSAHGIPSICPGDQILVCPTIHKLI